jgi:PD-(D/E)XK nuclease superfamily
MSYKYNPRKTRNIYKPGQTKTFKISRSKVESFISCPRCFYIDTVEGIKRPSGFPFNLNIAVDTLLKKEFDFYRNTQTVPPLLSENGLNYIPFLHREIDKWRANFTGVKYFDKEKNLLFYGALDDVWTSVQSLQSGKPELVAVDYKATSKNEPVNIDSEWQDGYKRQIEFYQWLLRKNGFRVSDTGYFVYCNGIKDRPFFNKKLEFDISLIPYKGNGLWIEQTIQDLFECMHLDHAPNASPDCEYCAWHKELTVSGL